MSDKKLSLAEKNRLRTTEKVLEALRKLEKSNTPINVNTVSKKADISRKTIYNRPDLKELILEKQALQNDAKAVQEEPQRKRSLTQAERINQLRMKNKQLIEDKKMILEQNMSLTKEVIKLRNRLSDLEDKLYSQSQLKVVELNPPSNK